ncbi:EscE/YscE/SsaE family type III secretion system needle protein co-chaperone [Serratia quinivorans]|uniref:EscE/YscE/SsaE family type III secretion system needle protein co-chaperone n=1 Tax=Serratia quinivorans TaxID=137545 RepID=UPI002177A436|nr:EscE/YscE/SsaE family type III secretion system needle protein co-chaperone [Serratia quinivorans]CAI1011047.1 type III secretion system protein, YseE family [Serratia quinivorans]CAI1811452.1 type III secretion system protein, YseE family [Serratia quinivorans]
MVAMTALETMLQGQQGPRHARRLRRLLHRREEKLRARCRLPLPVMEYQQCQRQVAACEAARRVIMTLCCRYHGTQTVGEDDDSA